MKNNSATFWNITCLNALFSGYTLKLLCLACILLCMLRGCSILCTIMCVFLITAVLQVQGPEDCCWTWDLQHEVQVGHEEEQGQESCCGCYSCTSCCSCKTGQAEGHSRYIKGGVCCTIRVINYEIILNQGIIISIKFSWMFFHLM